METDVNHGIDRGLVDFDILTAWMDERGLPRGTV
jgi:hypothetical protein